MHVAQLRTMDDLIGRFVVMQGLKPALAGVGVGTVAAFFAVRLLRTLLFDVTPLDPLTFAIVPPALLAVAALACYVPACALSALTLRGRSAPDRSGS